jgi:hypothetical protein
MPQFGSTSVSFEATCCGLRATSLAKSVRNHPTRFPCGTSYFRMKYRYPRMTSRTKTDLGIAFLLVNQVQAQPEHLFSPLALSRLWKSASTLTSSIEDQPQMSNLQISCKWSLCWRIDNMVFIGSLCLPTINFFLFTSLVDILPFFFFAATAGLPIWLQSCFS